MNRPQIRPEDDSLARENFAALNDSFYRSTPHDHFARKAFQLHYAAARPDELDKAARQGGIAFDGLRLQPNPEGMWQDSDAHEQFLAVESEVLLHHLGEALLRMYLGHEALPLCPWLEIARLRSFDRFKQRLRKQFIDSDADSAIPEIAKVFFGAASRNQLFGGQEDPSEERWTRGAQNIQSFLWYFAKRNLDYANLYNAAKHGLAIKAGYASSALLDPETGTPLIQIAGPSVEYLEVRDNGDGKRWNRTTTWVKVGRNFALIWQAINMMEALWSVARQRYVGATRTHVNLFDGLDLRLLLEETKQDEGILAPDSISASLLYYENPKRSWRIEKGGRIEE